MAQQQSKTFTTYGRVSRATGTFTPLTSAQARGLSAKEVAEYAKEILNKDKRGRRGLYKNLGMPLDKTVEIDEDGR